MFRLVGVKCPLFRWWESNVPYFVYQHLTFNDSCYFYLIKRLTHYKLAIVSDVFKLMGHSFQILGAATEKARLPEDDM